MKELNTILDKIKGAQKIIVLTGAGISTLSGIPDFRSDGGLWNNINVMRSMTLSYYNQRPTWFWPKYHHGFLQKIKQDAEPNIVHDFLKTLEDKGKDVHIFTQNVDSLHTKAGSSKVYEMHGNASTAICPKHKITYDSQYLLENEVPRCTHVNGKGNKCNFILKPNIVLFGENIHHYKAVEKEIKDADLLLVLGSSLEVSPVNMIPTLRMKKEASKILITLSPTEMDYYFDIILNHDLKDVFDSFIQNV